MYSQPLTTGLFILRVDTERDYSASVIIHRTVTEQPWHCGDETLHLGDAGVVPEAGSHALLGVVVHVQYNGFLIIGGRISVL